MKVLLIIVCYLIGVVISSIIFARFLFRYNNPKNCFGLNDSYVGSEQEHYKGIVLLSLFYPIAWIIIIIELNYNVFVNFVKYISKL
jgi:hypothetical protein